MQYFAPCACGEQVRVELYEAGTTRPCPACRAIVEIPNSITLRELAGDPYPTLRPIEKLKQALHEGADPFTGRCHGCGDHTAEFQYPILIQALTERVSADEDQGLKLGLTGLSLSAGPTQEQWHTFAFPLLLCPTCRDEFQSQSNRRKIQKRASTIGLLVLLIGFLYLGYSNPEAIAALSGLFVLIGAIAWALQFRYTANVDRFLLDWIRKIRWMDEAIDAEFEYTIVCGTERSCRETGREQSGASRSE